MLQKEIDDLCLRILIAIKRNTIEFPLNEKLYWNDVVKSCLNLIMNLSFRCTFIQVIITYYLLLLLLFI